MNVFTTDHPSSDGMPDGCENSSVAWVLGIALVLCPFMLGLLWFLNVTDNRDTTGYPPDPFWDVFQCAALDSLLVAVLAVALGRLCAFILRELWPASEVKCEEQG